MSAWDIKDFDGPEPDLTASDQVHAVKPISCPLEAPPLSREGESVSEAVKPVLDDSGGHDTALILPNDTKIRFCNAFHAMQNHLGSCDACCLYLYHGDEDLCERGKEIICRELAFADTSLDLTERSIANQTPAGSVECPANNQRKNTMKLKTETDMFFARLESSIRSDCVKPAKPETMADSEMNQYLTAGDGVFVERKWNDQEESDAGSVVRLYHAAGINGRRWGMWMADGRGGWTRI